MSAVKAALPDWCCLLLLPAGPTFPSSQTLRCAACRSRWGQAALWWKCVQQGSRADCSAAMCYWAGGARVARCTCRPPARCYSVCPHLCLPSACSLPPCQVIFTDPYFAAEHNRHTSPQLDADVAALRADVAARVAASQLKVGAKEAALFSNQFQASVPVCRRAAAAAQTPLNRPCILLSLPVGPGAACRPSSRSSTRRCCTQTCTPDPSWPQVGTTFEVPWGHRCGHVPACLPAWLSSLPAQSATLPALMRCVACCRSPLPLCR